MLQFCNSIIIPDHTTFDPDRWNGSKFDRAKLKYKFIIAKNLTFWQFFHEFKKFYTTKLTPCRWNGIPIVGLGSLSLDWEYLSDKRDQMKHDREYLSDDREKLKLE